MSFRLVLKSVTLNNLFRAAPWPLFCVISPKSAPSGADCIEVVEDTVRQKCSPKHLILGDHLYNGLLYAIGPLSVLSRLCCLSVMLVYCGQTVGRTKMKLGMEV